MATEDFKRKLSAIFSADVVGYSRLMAEDEALTVKTITAYREVMGALIKQHRGRVIDSPGDNLLAEFASVVDAVQCAVAIQKEFHTRNAELPENRRMVFRIGINLGDVIEEEDRIYGDGVNIAARLEALADPGGICVSKTAFDQIETKLPLGYEYLGEQPVKNIPKPVGAYRVLMEPRVTVVGKPEEEKRAPVWQMPILIGAVTLLVLIAAVGIWQLYMRGPSVDPASVEKMASPLPDKPSVAVLPSNNLSGDLEQAHGLTENKTKGKSVKVQQIDEETRKREAAEIARLENELAEMDIKIAAMKEDLRTTAVSEQDGLPAMLAMVEKREKQHQRLDELQERQQRAKEHDIRAYEKIVSSPYGKDLKETAWKELVANHPEAADLAPGKVEVLKLLLLKKWVEPTTGMEFVWVEGGCFQMGDIWKEGDDDEKPVHEVCVDSFGMSRYEVTQGQWQKIMGDNPSGFRQGDNYPVERVSWVDTQDFICKLNSHSGRSFRLPTEAEWEYAARSGGKKEKYAGGSDLDRLAWYEGNSGGSTHPVGTKEPNNLGLHDMSGNVWEWCSDWYGRNYYQQSPRNNPQGPSVGSFRVIRDGCWNGSSWLARSAHRDKFGPVYRLDNLGFRLVLPGK
jgi:formylglycine-generating enzyme required for sulfatase activity/class 3 adenylate cyclase